ncbi:hypothetical protein DERF_014190 [Dermatophagoides farinae]|uniref:Secreted protein n=1 Tax=Dermatophagoides farinae TaxID=6954 RepID=A0A922HGZ9_DERFA|nr:hypothetical protein DERF_014190 [Dermatophagoides farinae]
MHSKSFSFAVIMLYVICERLCFLLIKSSRCFSDDEYLYCNGHNLVVTPTASNKVLCHFQYGSYVKKFRVSRISKFCHILSSSCEYEKYENVM